MGRVYEAEHAVIGRRAAVKFIHESFASNEEIISRFFNEARSVNSIRHPNIVDVTDFGQSEYGYYIVMELLEGEPLDQRLRRVGRLEPEVAVRIGAQVAGALAAAHHQGVIHRDLKPDNIFLTNHPDYPDYVKVLDFGIAKLGKAQRAHHTQTGMVLGTPLYMSPEQCLGDSNLDHRSDVYSLGMVLYEMLAGKPAFDYEAIGRIIMAHVNETPDPLVGNVPDVPEALGALVARALAKDPAARHEDMRKMRSALVRSLRTPAPRSSRLVQAPAVANDQAGPAPEQLSPAERAGAENVRLQFNKIILERLANDRLVIPAMPGVAMECIDSMRNTAITFGAIARVLEQDPLLAPQVIRKANSAALGGVGKIETLRHAISRLGFAQLRTVLIELSAHKVFKSRNSRIRNAFKGIWEHSLAVAVLSREVASRVGGLDPEVAYLAGLLHDVGKPVVATIMLEAERMLAAENAEWMSDRLWLEVLNRAHREVGTAVAEKWELPESLCLAIADSGQFRADDQVSFANVVCLANAMAKAEGMYAGSFDADEARALVVEGSELLDLDVSELSDELPSLIESAS